MKRIALTIVAALAMIAGTQAQETKKFMVVNLSTGVQKTIPLDEVTNVEFQDIAPNPEIKTIEVNGAKFVMRKVEKGSFYMQTMEEDASKKVTLTKDFWMAETVVTRDLYKAVTGESLPSGRQPWWYNDYFPVELTLPQTAAFISKLNELTGKNFRLPTEAEWEYAARGGKYHTPTLYAGSFWYKDNYKLSTTGIPIVGTKEPNQLGIYDMSGLVWEWTSDIYMKASILPYGTDPANPHTGEFGTQVFTIRGGFYYSTLDECTVLYRDGKQAVPPGFDNFETEIGVRLVLTAE